MRTRVLSRRPERTVLAGLGQLWCRAMHNDLGWPVQGHYRCRRCNRVFEVPWEDGAAHAHAEELPAPARIRSVKPISIAA